MIVGGRFRWILLQGLIVADAQAQRPSFEPTTLESFGPFSYPVRFDGLERLEQELSSSTESRRISAYREIGFRNDRHSLALLARHLETPELTLSPLAQLSIARILAPHATSNTVYRMLLRHAFTVAMQSSSAEPLQRLAVQTSLLGLAASGTEQSLTDLGRALATEGILAEAATLALIAYPPSPTTRLLHTSVKRSPALLRLLGRLQVTDAVGFLRDQLLNATEALKLAAATALVDLRDPELVPLLKQWATDPNTPAEYQALARTAQTRDDAERSQDFVTVSLDHDIFTTTLLRHFSSIPTSLPTVESLHRALSSTNDANRWLAAALLSSVHPTHLLPFIDSRDLVIRRAIEWALPYLPPESPLTLAVLRRQSQTPPDDEPYRFYGYLIHREHQDRLPSSVLRGLARSNNPYAPLGAEGLAARVSPILTAEIRWLLTAADPRLRAATAQGLGRARLPSATGMLLNQFDVEAEPLVRRAIVTALQSRVSRLAHAPLNNIARYDPDPITRYLAANSVSPQTHAETHRDPFQSAFVGQSVLPPFQRSILPTSVGSSTEHPIAFRLRHPNHDTHVRVTGPLGRSLVVPLDPRGLLLVAGPPESLTMSTIRPTTLTVTSEPQD